jgi:uncharacterized glyoxalase superfamily protein PhnB
VHEFRVIVASSRFDESVAFYGERLGWPVTKQFPGGRIFGCGAQARIEVLDEPGATRSSTACAIHVDDADALHERLVAAGVPIVQPPTDQPWGHRNVTVEDPDGTRLTFFHELV